MEPRSLLVEALRGRRVLVVEGDPAAPSSRTAQLRALGLTTDAATSGPEALLRLARDPEPAGLIVIGADLPGMGAAGLERALRGRPETRAVPLLTLPGGPIDPRTLLHALAAVPSASGSSGGAALDLAAASARLGLGPGEIADVLRGFAPQAEAHLGALARAAAAADADAVRREAHALAGAAGNLGATALHAAAKALEHAARGGGSLGAPLAEVARAGAAALAAITALPSAAGRDADAAPAAAPHGELADRRVLVVDDARANVDLLVRALKDDYLVSVAFDGESALRSVVARPPDLILLDIMMPGLDGYEVCRRLKRDPATRDLPIVFLSALDEVRDKTQGFEAGAADYITKPFEMLEVKARVRALLRAKAYQDAVRELLEGELRVAREIQRGLLPHDFAALATGGAVECFACLEPARAVGGDLYDVFRLDARRLCVVVGDVSGKGIPAALFMVMTLTLIRSIARLSGRPDEILSRVNDALAADNPSGMFVTLLCAVLDEATGRLICASGGHCSPVLARAGRPSDAVLGAEGPLVGVLPGVTFPSRELTLAPGDLLVAFTDGVTEAVSPGAAQFGEPGVRAALDALTEPTPAHAVHAILRGVREFAGGAEQADDIAIVAIRYAPPAAAASEITLEIGATLAEAGRAAGAVRALCEARRVPGEALDDLLLGLDEVLANVVTHGYRGDPAGRIDVLVRVGAAAVELEIRDRAPAFNPVEATAPDLDLPLDRRPAGGLGLYLTRSVMDGMTYERVDETNRLRLTRSLAPRAR